MVIWRGQVLQKVVHMVRQRDVFRKFEAPLHFAARVTATLPPSIRRGLLDLFRNVPGRFGLGVRYILLRSISRSVGSIVAIFEGAYLREPHLLDIGNNVSIHPMCYLDATGGLRIGDDVSLAHGVTIMSTEHDYVSDGVTIRDAPLIHAPVCIGNDVWVGAGAKILAGVTVGDHVVIGAGAVVTTDIPSNSVAVGVPARVVKTMDGPRAS